MNLQSRQNIKNKLLSNIITKQQNFSKHRTIEKSVEKRKYLNLTSIQDFLTKNKQKQSTLLSQNNLPINYVAKRISQNQSQLFNIPTHASIQNYIGNVQNPQKVHNKNETSKFNVVIKYSEPIKPQIINQVQKKQVNIEPIIIVNRPTAQILKQGCSSPVHAMNHHYSYDNLRGQTFQKRPRILNEINKIQIEGNLKNKKKPMKIRSLKSIFETDFPQNCQYIPKINQETKIKKKANNNNSEIRKKFRDVGIQTDKDLQLSTNQISLQSNYIRNNQLKSPLQLAYILKQSNQIPEYPDWKYKNRSRPKF